MNNIEQNTYICVRGIGIGQWTFNYNFKCFPQKLLILRRNKSTIIEGARAICNSIHGINAEFQLGVWIFANSVEDLTQPSHYKRVESNLLAGSSCLGYTSILIHLLTQIEIKNFMSIFLFLYSCIHVQMINNCISTQT